MPMTDRRDDEHTGVDAVCFRLDNAVLDTRAFLRECADRAMAEQGLAPLEDHEHRNLYLDGDEIGFVTVIIERDGVTLDHEVRRRLTARYREFVDDRILTAVEPVPGMTTLLEELRRTGITIGGSTGLRREHAVGLLSRYGLDEAFGSLVCVDDLHRSPYSGEVALEGLNALEAPETCGLVLVSDNHHDLEAAKWQQVRSIAVRWGMTPDLSIGIMSCLGIESASTPVELLGMLSPRSDRGLVHHASRPPMAALVRLEDIVFNVDATADAIRMTLGINARRSSAMAAGALKDAYDRAEQRLGCPPTMYMEWRLNRAMSAERSRDLEVQHRLFRLSTEGVRLGAYTDLPANVAFGMLTMLNRNELFHSIYVRQSREEGIVAAYEYLNQDLAVKDPAECFVITDRVDDAIAAVEWGSDAALVTWTATPHNDLDRIEQLHSLDRVRIQPVDTGEELEDAIRESLLLDLDEAVDKTGS